MPQSIRVTGPYPQRRQLANPRLGGNFEKEEILRSFDEILEIELENFMSSGSQ